MTDFIDILKKRLFGDSNFPGAGTIGWDVATGKIPPSTLPKVDWRNPQQRVELPADFPPPLYTHYDIKLIAQQLDAELKKHGSSIEEVERINIAFPHKHPGMFPKHENAADHSAQALYRQMEESPELSRIQWNIMDELVETRKLGRSENQTSVHALTAKQKYVFYTDPKKLPTETSQLALMGDNRKEFFVVADWTSEQGTTFANLISHIRANGGVVLATFGARQLVQQQSSDEAKEKAKLPSKFTDPARNTGKLPDLALAFARSANIEGKDWTPAECLEKFEQGLQRHGNSVFAMTDGEVTRVIDTMNGWADGSSNFVRLLKKLDRKATIKAVLKPFRS